MAVRGLWYRPRLGVREPELEELLERLRLLPGMLGITHDVLATVDNWRALRPECIRVIEAVGRV